MQIMTEDTLRLTLAALLSLGTHLLLFALTAPPQKTVSSRPPMEVEMISPEKLKQYRSVGIKNGSKRFSIPIPLTPPAPPFSLKSLQTNAPAKIAMGKTSKAPPSPSWKKEKIRSSETSFLQRSDLSIRFDPPEGVGEDELNDAEKTFWSFRKRVYETFASSVLSTYNRMLIRRPQIKGALKNVENHVMAGKMVFDEKGNILRIKIIRPSDQDDLQALFEQSLRNINKIPNPPKNLLSDKELSLYYQLIINHR